MLLTSKQIAGLIKLAAIVGVLYLIFGSTGCVPAKATGCRATRGMVGYK